MEANKKYILQNTYMFWKSVNHAFVMASAVNEKTHGDTCNKKNPSKCLIPIQRNRIAWYRDEQNKIQLS